MIFLRHRLYPVSAAAGLGMVLLLTLGIWIQPAIGGDCIDYADFARWVAALDLPPSQDMDVAVDGIHAYIAAGASGEFYVIDISLPQSPRILGSTAIGGPGRAIAVSSGVAYVAAGASGLYVVDISDPGAPAVIGSVDTPAMAMDVAVDGTLALVADWDYGLQVIDVSNPGSPAIIGNIDMPGFAVSIATAGGHAYVADLVGLEIIDLSNPSSPRIAGAVETPSESEGVAVRGDHAYVALFKHGLQVIDISNPASPAIVGSLSVEGGAIGIDVDDQQAYIVSSSAVHIAGVANPAAPVLKSSVPTSAPVSGIGLGSGHALVTTNRGLEVIEVTHPDSPPVAGTLTTGISDAMDLALDGSHAFIADFSRGLLIADVSDPTFPVIVVTIAFPGTRPLAVAAAEGRACVGTFQGLQVVAYENPAEPVVGGSLELPPPNLVESVVIKAHYAYATTRSELTIIDVSDPDSPAIAGSIDPPGNPVDVALSGSRAYVASNNSFTTAGSLQVIDVSDPALPAVVGECELPFNHIAVSVAADRALACVATGSSTGSPGLFVLDITDPDSPVIVGSLYTPGQVNDIALHGEDAYLTGDFGFLVADISTPSTPAIRGGASASSRASAVATDGAYAYVAQGWPDGGLQIFFAQCPGPNPVLLSSFTAEPAPGAILVTWRTSFEFNHFGFHLHRSIRRGDGYISLTSTPIQPPPPYAFLDTDVRPGTIYFYRLEALDGGSGQFFGPVAARMEDSAAVAFHDRLAPTHPNPFRGGGEPAAIEYELARSGRATLRIFDASGRLVRLVFDGVLAAGDHTGHWDGRNTRGDLVGSGIYYCRLDAGSFSATRPLVRLR